MTRKKKKSAAPPAPLALTVRRGNDHPAGAAEDEPDEQLVDRAVAHLRRVIVASQVRAIVEAGELLIREFYGSVDSARSKNPRKPASLRRLAERAAEFGMSPATLANVVPITLAARDIGLSISDDLGVSRLRALTPVKDREQRRLLAETATASNWTVEKLRERVRKIEKPHPGGRPPLPAVDRAVSRLARAADAEIAEPNRLREGLADLTPRRARTLLAAVNRIQANVERVEKLLQRVAASGD